MGIFKNYPNNSNMQPRLRTTDLDPSELISEQQQGEMISEVTQEHARKWLGNLQKTKKC